MAKPLVEGLEHSIMLIQGVKNRLDNMNTEASMPLLMYQTSLSLMGAACKFLIVSMRILRDDLKTS